MNSFDVFKDKKSTRKSAKNDLKLLKKKPFEDMSVDEKLIYLNRNFIIQDKRIGALNRKFSGEQKAKTLFSQWLKKSLRSFFVLRKINTSLTTRLTVFSEIRFLLDGTDRQPTVLRGYAMAADFDDEWWNERDQLTMHDWTDLLGRIGQEKSFLIACEKYKGRESDKHVISTDDIIGEDDE